MTKSRSRLSAANAAVKCKCRRGAPHLFRNGTLEARKKMRAAAKCEWKRRNNGKPNGPDLCGAIVLENNRLMWPQEIYREAIKRGFGMAKRCLRTRKETLPV